MRLIFLLAGIVGGILPLRAEPPAPPPPVLPAMPGYELRALDQHKRVRFQVGGSRVEVSVPVFAYCPAAGAPPVARLLRETQAGLLELAAKPEWTADELREVMARLDRAIRLLESPILPGTPVVAGLD
jgi:hypothetical protein